MCRPLSWYTCTECKNTYDEILICQNPSNSVWSQILFTRDMNEKWLGLNFEDVEKPTSYMDITHNLASGSPNLTEETEDLELVLTCNLREMTSMVFAVEECSSTPEPEKSENPTEKQLLTAFQSLRVQDVEKTGKSCFLCLDVIERREQLKNSATHFQNMWIATHKRYTMERPIETHVQMSINLLNGKNAPSRKEIEDTSHNLKSDIQYLTKLRKDLMARSESLPKEGVTSKDTAQKASGDDTASHTSSAATIGSSSSDKSSSTSPTSSTGTRRSSTSNSLISKRRDKSHTGKSLSVRKTSTAPEKTGLEESAPIPGKVSRKDTSGSIESASRKSKKGREVPGFMVWAAGPRKY